MDEKQPIPLTEQFKHIAIDAPVLIWMSDVNQLACFFNQGWLNFTGRSLGQELGNGWVEGVHPGDFERCDKIFQDSYKGHKEFKVQYRLRRHDGVYIWLAENSKPRYDAEGQFLGYIGSCVDIDELMKTEIAEKQNISATALQNEQALNEELASSNEELMSINEEQAAANEEFVVLNEELHKSQESLNKLNSELEERIKQRTQDLAESEQRLWSMVTSAPFPIGVYTGKEMKILMANQSILDIWGKGDDVIGKRYADILPELDNQEIFNQLDGVFTTGIAFHNRNQKLELVVNGTLQVFYFNYSFTPLFDAEGKVYGVMNTGADVTDMNVAKQKLEISEAELQETKVQLEKELAADKELQRQKDDFIGIASHELKTPLTSITAIVQLLSRKLKENKDPFIAGAMDKANAQVKKMISLINGFLNVSRLESGKLLIVKQPFNLEKLIIDAVDDAQITTHGHQISIYHCEPITVNADHDKISIVVSNLLSNAIKYSPTNTNIAVSCAVKEDLVEVSVKDEGMGVNAEDLDKLFDRYYRVETHSTKDISGFGIGLYLSAEIIKQHGGQIWVTSEENSGSSFFFSLPING